MRNTVHLDFSGGVDQRTDKRHVMPGKLTSLVNGQFDKDGSIRKRRGFTALSRATVAGATLSAAKHLASLDDELVCIDGTDLHSYSSAASKWVTKDAAPICAVLPSQRVVAGASSTRNSGTLFAGVATNYVAPDYASVNGYHVVGWLDQYCPAISGGNDLGIPTLSIMDATTGVVVVPAYQLETTLEFLGPRLVVVGTNLFVFYANIVGDIFGRMFDTATLTWSSRVTVVTNAINSTAVDYQVATNASQILVVYTNDSGASPRLSYRALTASSTLPSLGTGTINDNSFAGPFQLATVSTTGETWWIHFATVSAGAVEWWAVGHNPATYAQTVAPFRISNAVGLTHYNLGVVRLSSTLAIGVLSVAADATAPAPNIAYWRQVSTAGAVGTLRRVGSAIWASKPIVTGGRTLAWTLHWPTLSSDTDPSLVLVDLRTSDSSSTYLNARPLALVAPRLARREALAMGNPAPTLPSVAVSAASVLTTAIGTRPAFEQTALEVARVDLAPRYTSGELGRALFLSGGFPSAYDGNIVAEAAFLTTPEPIVKTSVLNGSGSLTVSSSYQYSIVASWTNARGEVMRSAPSTPVTVVTGASDDTARFYVTAMPYTLISELETNWNPSITLEVYRTKAGGTTFYRVPGASLYDTTLTRFGDPISDGATWHQRQFEDRAADSALDGQPILYVQGGALSSVSPPGSAIVCIHKDRACLADGNDVWFTTQFAIGTFPRWNELLRFSVKDGGPITALASAGTFLAIFKRGSIYLVGGDGPDVTGGTGQEFSPPQKVASDVGCIDPRSIVLTPLGLVFQSTAGFYLLSSSGQVQYLSGPVEDTLAANPTVTSVTVHESLFQVRWTCNASTTSGVMLVWDYFPSPNAPLGRWSVFQLYDGTAAQASTAVNGSCNSRGTFYWVAPNGQVYQESTTSHLDGSQWVTLSLETAWFKFAGLQGFQRIWAVGLLAEYFTDHNISFQHAVDYSDTYETAVIKNVQSAFGLEQLRYVPRKQKGQAFRVKFSDATPSAGSVGSGRALSLTGLSLEVKTLPKINRLPAAKRA